MSFIDLVTLIIDNLSRRKGRVALTAIGVVIGTAAVVILVSLGIGLQQNAINQLYGIGDLTQIYVYPNYGESPIGPGVVAVEVVGPGGVPANQKLITNDSLTELSAIPGVIAVVPRDWMYGGAIITYNRLETGIGITGVGTNDLTILGVEAQVGSTTLERGTAIIGSQIPNNFYNPRWRPGQPEPTPPDLVGQTVQVTLMKWNPEDNSEIRKNVRVKIIGLLSEEGGEPDYSVYMPLDDVTAYNEWFMGTKINRNKDGYNQVIVKVDDVDNALEIRDQIRTLGYQAESPQDYVQGINSFYLILQVIFGGVGAVALIVAAIGIANTMAMAILERTREIGLMKAVGATNRDVLSVFLGESAGIGFLGGIGGVILGWSAGQIINVLATAYMAGQAAQRGGPPPGTAVTTPVWLPITALIFATIIGLISGLYPALRAATLIPVNALKYE
jgi:putative ABC transport system permease protein